MRLKNFSFNPGEASCVQKEEMDLRFHLAEKLSVPLVLSFNHVSFKMSALSQRLQFGASLISRPNGH